MNPVFDDRGFVLRSWISVAVLVAAVIWGIVEIVRAQTGSSDETGLLFGFGFLAAAAYGLYRLLSESRDQIVRLEADFGSRQAVVTQWRPWGFQRLATSLDQLTGWRMYVAVRRRNQPTYLLHVNHPASRRPLHIELIPGKKTFEGLRQVAPEAIEEFEQRTGARKAA